MRLESIILLLLFLVGCNPGFEPTVVITPTLNALEISNKTDDPVYYIAAELEYSKQIELENPCEDFQPNLPAKSTISLPYSEIPGVDEDSEYIWFFWTNCDGLNDTDTYRISFN